MLDGFTIGRNYAGDSTIHRLTGKTKVLVAAALILGVLIEGNPSGLALLGVYLVILVIISRVPFVYCSRNMPVLILGVVLILLSSALAYPGHAWFSVGPVAVTHEGVWRGLILGYKVLFTFLTLSVLTLTTSPLAISHAMASFLAPLEKLGVPIEELVIISMISVSHIPLLLEDVKRIVDAQVTRGGDFHSHHLIRRARTLFSVLVALIAVSLRRAEDLAVAMEIRCYRVGGERTRYREERMASIDIFVLVTTGLFAAGAIWL